MSSPPSNLQSVCYSKLPQPHPQHRRAGLLAETPALALEERQGAQGCIPSLLQPTSKLPSAISCHSTKLKEKGVACLGELRHGLLAILLLPPALPPTPRSDTAHHPPPFRRDGNQLCLLQDGEVPPWALCGWELPTRAATPQHLPPAPAPTLFQATGLGPKIN